MGVISVLHKVKHLKIHEEMYIDNASQLLANSLVWCFNMFY